MSQQAIVNEIDKTLDQLIQNAEVVSGVHLSDLSDIELDAFQKTQESLLQHLLVMDQRLATAQSPSRKLREKRERFDFLKTQVEESIVQHTQRCMLSKRRKKKFFDLRFRKKKVFVPR